MPIPGEHKTIQAKTLEYADPIGWTIVSVEEAEQRRGFNPEALPTDRAGILSLYFCELLSTEVCECTPRYADVALLDRTAISTPTSTAVINLAARTESHVSF